MFNYGLLHMDTPVMTNQKQDAIKRTCQEWWPRGMDDKRESKESMQLTCIDDDFRYTGYLN